MPSRALTEMRTRLTEVAWGRARIAERLLVAVLAEGHVLIEDVPGVGKSSLVTRLAQALGVSFQRIQCTPDLLPSDVTGYTYYEPQAQTFTFRPGPVLTNLLLVDEINRTSPKTQASLLEAMEERQVTVDGVRHELPWPFTVLATENPIGFEGTFPLPEAQLDRFLLRLRLGYPESQAELAVLQTEGFRQKAPELTPLISLSDLRDAVEAAQAVPVGEPVAQYALAAVQGTRSHEALSLGVSPRGAIAWVRAARALAYLRDERYVAPDHLRELADEVLAHRVVVRADGTLRGVTGTTVVQEVLARTPLPQSAPRR